MKKVKALIVLSALVAVVAIAGIAQAAQVQVTSTFAETLDVTGCSLDLGALTVDTDNTGDCVEDYFSNDPDGYILSFAATNATLDNETVSGESIDSLATSGEASCSAAVTAEKECFSYTFSVDDPEAATGTYAGNIDSTEGTVPTSSAAQFTSAANDEGDDTYTFTFHAVPQQSTAAGTHSLTGGSITIGGQTP